MDRIDRDFGQEQLCDEAEGGARFVLDLAHLALLGGFVGTPAEELGSVAEAASGEVIVLHFDDELRLERLELAGTFGAPAAGTAGTAAGEAWGLAEGFQFLRELLAFGGGNGGCEAHVVEEAVVSIQTEQE